MKHGYAWLLAAGFLAALWTGDDVRAGDWPQILGPDRNGVARDERLASAWPAAGPPLLWRHSVGSGFAGTAIQGDRAIVFHRLGDEETVEALSASDGRGLWKRAFPSSYVDTIAGDDGPRCVPIVHQGKVLVFGARGGLHALSLEDGKVLWSRETFADFSAPDGYFGAGSSPIVVGERVLVNVGGNPEGGLVAFSLEDGRTEWTVAGELASYSSPVTATIDGKTQVVFVTRYNLLSLDPEDGRVLGRIPFGQRGPTVNGANPLVIGESVLATSSYGVGAVLARLTATGPQSIWNQTDVLSSQYTTPVPAGNAVYGVDGRQDVGQASLICFDPILGVRCWSKPGFGYATLIHADGKLLAMKTDGQLTLARVNPEAFEPLAESRLGEGIFRALPALAEGRFFVRNESTLFCFDLR